MRSKEKGDAKKLENIINKNCMSGQNEKGITLVALVVTIIILLILAGVAINMAIRR